MEVQNPHSWHIQFVGRGSSIRYHWEMYGGYDDAVRDHEDVGKLMTRLVVYNGRCCDLLTVLSPEEKVPKVNICSYSHSVAPLDVLPKVTPARLKVRMSMFHW